MHDYVNGGVDGYARHPSHGSRITHPSAFIRVHLWFHLFSCPLFSVLSVSPWLDPLLLLLLCLRVERIAEAVAEEVQ